MKKQQKNWIHFSDFKFMKISIERSDERGTTELGWLHSRHSFSFGNYHNPKRMGFGVLRVFNEDIVEPGKGFGTHFHDNFEIVSIILEGALEHKDSMSNHGIIPSGDIQRISAGTGISHSEFNHSSNEKVHFLQIWIEPNDRNIKPSYEQKSFLINKNRLVKVVSGIKNKDTIYIHQDANFSLGNFDKNKTISYKLNNSKHGVFVFVIEGKIEVDKSKLEKDDAAEITETEILKIKSNERSQILVIEVPLS